MNEKVKQLRQELNDAIYTMLDASSDKKFNGAERLVYVLRFELQEAYRDILYANAFTCCVCGESFDDDNFYSADDMCEFCHADMYDEVEL